MDTRRPDPTIPAVTPLTEEHYDNPVEDTRDLKIVCEFILRQMVHSPDDFIVNWGHSGTKLHMNVSIKPESDQTLLGLLIGKRGNTIGALRRVLQVVSLRYGYFVHVNLKQGPIVTETPADTEVSS